MAVKSLSSEELAELFRAIIGLLKQKELTELSSTAKNFFDFESKSFKYSASNSPGKSQMVEWKEGAFVSDYVECAADKSLHVRYFDS